MYLCLELCSESPSGSYFLPNLVSAINEIFDTYHSISYCLGTPVLQYSFSVFFQGTLFVRAEIHV